MCLLVLVALALASSPVWAQDGPATVYEDVQLLVTIRKLDLTPEQMQRLLATAQTLDQQRQAIAEARATTWEEQQANIAAVNDAWLKGEDAPKDAQQAANKAIGEITKAEKTLAETEAKMVEGLIGDLTKDQRQHVETKQQADQRHQRQAALAGFATVGEYVAYRIEQMRDLMPDEYNLLRVADAREMATRIVGAGAPNLDQFTDALLRIMDQVMSWSAENFDKQHATLPAQISKFLGIEEQQLSDEVVRYEQLLALMKSGRTAALLAEIQASQGGGEG